MGVSHGAATDVQRHHGSACTCQCSTHIPHLRTRVLRAKHAEGTTHTCPSPARQGRQCQAGQRCGPTKTQHPPHNALGCGPPRACFRERQPCSACSPGRPATSNTATTPAAQYSAKLVWPVSLACMTASFSPLSPIWHTPQRSVNVAVLVNWRALWHASTSRAAPARGRTGRGADYQGCTAPHAACRAGGCLGAWTRFIGQAFASSHASCRMPHACLSCRMHACMLSCASRTARAEPLVAQPMLPLPAALPPACLHLLRLAAGDGQHRLVQLLGRPLQRQQRRLGVASQQDRAGQHAQIPDVRPDPCPAPSGAAAPTWNAPTARAS